MVMPNTLYTTIVYVLFCLFFNNTVIFYRVLFIYYDGLLVCACTIKCITLRTHLFTFEGCFFKVWVLQTIDCLIIVTYFIELFLTDISITYVLNIYVTID